MEEELSVLPWLYFVPTERSYRPCVTFVPPIDHYYWQRRGYQTLHFFMEPLFPGWIYSLLLGLDRKRDSFCRRLQKRGQSLGLLLPGLKEEKIRGSAPVLSRKRSLLRGLERILAGRLLYPWEVKRALRERGYQGTFARELQQLLLEGRIIFRPSLTLSVQGGFYCFRCGSREAEELESSTSGALDYHCLHCGVMGESRFSRFLLAGRATDYEDLKPYTGSCQPGFTLSGMQKKASRRLERLVLEEKKKRVLFWAVCGAGKTEVTFSIIHRFLQQGKRVLFALPRRDVVEQLGERMREAFSLLEPVVLTGQSKRKYQHGRLYLATTHQVLKFNRFFQLIILDEFDAFPYTAQPMLAFGLRRALAPLGQLVYMSATPGEEYLERSDRENWGLVSLPLRYHHHPLPEPQLAVVNLQLSMEKRELPPVLFTFFYRSLFLDGARVLVFVPSRDLTRQVAGWLRSNLAELSRPVKVGAVHAHHNERQQQVQSFSRRKTEILVTTTMLERGITIARCNVLVLFASWERIFTTGVLLQISGRAGRSADYPQGRVFFCGSKISASMRQARRQVCRLNQWARRRGLLESSQQK